MSAGASGGRKRVGRTELALILACLASEKRSGPVAPAVHSSCWELGAAFPCGCSCRLQAGSPGYGFGPLASESYAGGLRPERALPPILALPWSRGTEGFKTEFIYP